MLASLIDKNQIFLRSGRSTTCQLVLAPVRFLVFFKENLLSITKTPSLLLILRSTTTCHIFKSCNNHNVPGYLSAVVTFGVVGAMLIQAFFIAL